MTKTKSIPQKYIKTADRFVGREFELAYLQDALIQSMEGQGQLLLIAGAIGAGKMRLMHEVQTRAQVQRIVVLEVACEALAKGPYRVWANVLHRLLHDRDVCFGEAIAPHLPLLAQISPELAEGAPQEAAAPEALPDRERIWEAVAEVLLACDQPLLLIIQDMHHADAESIALLDYVGQRAREGYLLICALYQDDAVDESHPLNVMTQRADWVSQHQRSQTPNAPYALLHLDPLPEVHVADLLRSVLRTGSEPPVLPDGLLPYVMEQAGGNPQLSVDIVVTLLASAMLYTTEAGWQLDAERLTSLPVGVQAATQHYMDSLEQQPAVLALLQWAAVMGQWLDIETLVALTELPLETVLDYINTATALRILHRHQQAQRRAYHFSHHQVRQTIYETLPADVRAQYHRRVAEVLQNSALEGQIADTLAWHFERAGDIPLALRYARRAAQHAQQMYANASAIQYYSQSLRLLRKYPDVADATTRYELLSNRANAYRLVGNRAAQRADLEAMGRIAEEMGDATRHVEVVTRQVALANQMGNQAEAVEAAETALALAKQVGDRKLEADILTALGEAAYNLGEQERPYTCHEQALQLYRDLGDRAGEANSLRLLARAAYRMGQVDQVQEHYEQALALYRELRDRAGEANVLNALGVITSDYARARDYFEQSLAIRQAIGDRSGQGNVYNNLALVYWSLGLYERARDYLEQAVRIERDVGGRAILAYYLESLGRVYLDLADYERAQEAFEEGRALAKSVGDRWVESVYWLGLGRVALEREDFDEALHLLQAACDMQADIGALSELATSQAWLGAAYLALGDYEAALRYTERAIENLQIAGNTGDYAPQDVWWLRYRVLKAGQSSTPPVAVPEDAWLCLQQAYHFMMSGVASLSDEGLRRNYLNKVQINRDIVAEWTRQSALHASEIAPAVPIVELDAATEAEQLKERLRRVLNVSRQMNELHEADALLAFVMDQVIELSGAERGFLVLTPAQGAMDFKVTRGMSEEELHMAKTQRAYAVLQDVAESKMPVLLQDSPDVGHGAADEDAALHTRSVLCVPMLSRAELLGMIYVDNRTVSGRFSQADLDLLTLFGNQAATAIENVQLYQETVAWANLLEQRVTERTFELLQANKSLSRRARQLETSNQIGQQLTSLLDRDELLKQVVRQIQRQFDYYFVGVWLLTEEETHVVLQAGAGRDDVNGHRAGFRIPIDRDAPIAVVARTGEGQLLEDTCMLPANANVDTLPDTCTELVLPLKMGAMILGVLDIQGDQPDAFNEDDRLVLQTLANQIAITIRNAQLYATEMRRRRLAESLEKAGRELVSSLDMEEIPGRILEQLAAVVPYTRCSIMLKQDHTLHIVAQRGFPDDQQARQVRIAIDEDDVALGQMLSTQRPVIFDDVTQVEGWHFVEGLSINHAWLGVPLFAQDTLIGMISMTRPNVGAFSAEESMLASAFAAQAAVALENARLYDELNRAYHTLERLDRTKTNFIEVTAHELRTPLTVIKGYAQLLRILPSVKDDAQAKPALEGILSGMERMHEIVNSILDVTKIDSDALKVIKHTLDISNVLTKVVIQFEAALEERHLTLTLDAMDALPEVQADPDLLQKVFYHLVVNAIKYTPDGGHITIHSQVDEHHVEVIVSDTGIGIDAEHQELIFEKFYQTGGVALHSSGRTKFKGGGPGLGLAITRGIVEAHGGTIWVESDGYDEETCPGSHFHVRLPRG